MNSATLQRFEDKVIKGDECWLWTASGNGRGYGKLFTEGRRFYAHRLSYEHYIGPIPEDKEIDHLCRVPACVNPAHLEPVTHQENMRRGKNGVLCVRKTHCPRGHPFTPENLCPRTDGGQRCRICNGMAGKAWYARKREREREEVVDAFNSAVG